MIGAMLLEEECIVDGCKVVVGIDNGLDFFVSAIELSDDFEIIADERNDDGDLLIVKDLEKADGKFGVYIGVSVSEIMKIKNFDGAIEFLRVMRGDRNSIVLHGITRIVGYYSRVNNWNKSKTQELRQRVESRMVGGYILGKDKPIYQEEALMAIDNISLNEISNVV